MGVSTGIGRCQAHFVMFVMFVVLACGVLAAPSGAGGTQGQYAVRADPSGGAELAAPRTVAVDRAGHIYVTDTDHHRIRRIARTGTIRQLAAGLDLREPRGLNTDPSGLVVVADTGHDRIVAVTPANSHPRRAAIRPGL